MRRLKSERGTALLETALTLPLLLLVSVGIFEFGRAYQVEQVLTNAAREGARVAVIPGTDTATVQARVRGYLTSGQMSNPNSAVINVTAVNIPMGATNVPGTRVTVNYPFSFIVLNPVARLVVRGSTLGNAPITMVATSEMRNE